MDPLSRSYGDYYLAAPHGLPERRCWRPLLVAILLTPRPSLCAHPFQPRPEPKRCSTTSRPQCAQNTDRRTISNMDEALLSAKAPLSDSWRHGQNFARIRSSQGRRLREAHLGGASWSTGRDLIDRTPVEVGRDAEPLDHGQRILLGGPVLERLKILAEAHAHIRVPLMHNHVIPRPRQGNRGGQPSRTGSDNRDGPQCHRALSATWRADLLTDLGMAFMSRWDIIVQDLTLLFLPNVSDEPRAKAYRLCESGDQRERTRSLC